MDALISTAQLAERLDDPQLKILDGSWYLPKTGRDGRAEYRAKRIPGARFFDIPQISDRSSPLPHMLPPPEQFAQAVSSLGIRNEDTVVVYDGSPMFSAPRVWWTFRYFGHDRITVLNGGLPKWARERRALDSSPPAEPAASPASFSVSPRPELIVGLQQMRGTVDSGAAQIVDARGAGRFEGTAPEPRPGVRGGHMPGAQNLPYAKLIAEDGTLLDPAVLRALFESAGIDLQKAVITTCGSGVTASVLALGLHTAGILDAPVFDGSWAQWGSLEDTPVVTDSP